MRIGGVFSLPDGSDCVLASVSATIPADLSRESKDKAAALGLELANIMRAQGAQPILDRAHALTRGTNINAAPAPVASA